MGVEQPQPHSKWHPLNPQKSPILAIKLSVPSLTLPPSSLSLTKTHLPCFPDVQVHSQALFFNKCPARKPNDIAALVNNSIGTPRRLREKDWEPSFPFPRGSGGNSLSSHTHCILMTLGFTSSLSSCQFHNVVDGGWQ